MSYMKQVLDIMGIKNGVEYELIDAFQNKTRVKREKYFIVDNYGDALSDIMIGGIVSGKCTIKEVKQYTELDKLMAQHLIDNGKCLLYRDELIGLFACEKEPNMPLTLSTIKNGNRKVDDLLFLSIKEGEVIKLSDIVG